VNNFCDCDVFGGTGAPRTVLMTSRGFWVRVGRGFIIFSLCAFIQGITLRSLPFCFPFRRTSSLPLSTSLTAGMDPLFHLAIPLLQDLDSFPLDFDLRSFIPLGHFL